MKVIETTMATLSDLWQLLWYVVGGMTTLDLSIAAVLLISTLIGIYRGFVREALSLVILVVALVVGISFSRLPAVFLPDVDIREYTLAGADLQLGLVFLLLFAVVLFVGGIIKNVVSGRVRRSFMSVVDRLFGAGFGLVRGGIIILALVLLSGLTGLPFTKNWRTALLIPSFEQFARYTMCHVPEGYKNPHYLCDAMSSEEL